MFPRISTFILTNNGNNPRLGNFFLAASGFISNGAAQLKQPELLASNFASVLLPERAVFQIVKHFVAKAELTGKPQLGRFHQSSLEHP